MKLLHLLGKRLKDEEVIDVLDSAEMEVVYDFDRMHENAPDTYWATSTEQGLQLRFDADQILDAAFLYVAPADGFAPFQTDDCDVPVFGTVRDAEAYATEHKLRSTKGTVESFGAPSDWVRIEHGSHSLHFEFRGGTLAQVTVTRTT